MTTTCHQSVQQSPLNLFESGTAIVGGLRIIDGQTPYVDFFAFYGPLTYLFPGLLFEATGSATTADFGLGLIIGVVSSAVGYGIALAATRRSVLSLVVPATLILIGATTARSLPALVSVLLLMQWERTRRQGWIIAAGVAGGIGLLWIQDAGAWMCVSVAIVALAGLFARPIRAVLGWVGFLRYAIGVAIAVAPWAAFMLVRGGLVDWLYWSFIFPNAGYTERDATGYFFSLVASAFEGGVLRAAYVLALYVLPFLAIPALALGNVVVASLRLRRGDANNGPAVAVLVLAVYGLLQLRVLLASIDEAKLIDSAAPTIACALVLAVGALRGRRSARRIIATVVIAWLVVWGFASAGRALILKSQSPRPISTAEVGGLPFNGAAPPTTTPQDLDDLLADVQTLSTADDGILVLPTSPLLYAMASRENVTAYDYLDPVYTTESVDAEIAEAIRDGGIRLVILGDNSFPGSRLRGADIAPQTYAAIEALYDVRERIAGFALLTPKTNDR